jgi:hypothetical protein
MLAAALALLPSLGAAPAVGQAPSPAGPDYEVLGCVLTPTIRAEPLRVPLGEAVTLSLHVQGSCSYWMEPKHVVFVIDASNALSAEAFDRLREWYRVTIDRIAADEQLRIGVVTFGEAVRTVCGLGDALQNARNCLDGIVPAGEPDVNVGLRQGLAAMREGQALVPEGRGFEQYVILVSQGTDPRGCGPAIETASEYSQEGALRISICASEQCEAECLRSIASAARYHYDRLDTSRGFIQALYPIDRGFLPPRYLREVTASMLLPDTWPLVPGSVQPVPIADETDPRRPSWQARFVPRDGITFSLALRSTKLGMQAVADAVHAGLRTESNQSYTADLEPPNVEVFMPEPTSTPAPARCYMPLLQGGVGDSL